MNNKSMQDNIDLIRSIKNGDEDKFNELLVKHHNMIYKIINIFSLKVGDYYIDTSDLYQEASIALYRAIFTFEEDKNVKFSTYAYMAIRNKLSTIIKKYKGMYQEEFFSLDLSECSDNMFMVSDVSLDYHKESRFQDYLDSFVKKLSDEDKKIVDLYKREYSYKDIAKALNTSTKRVDNRLCSLRRRLREYVDKY